MKSTLISHHLLVQKSPIHGYGVFAGAEIKAGETIEECHVIVAKKEKNVFMNYYFAADNASILALGYGSIYNHSSHPNANYLYDEERGLLVFRANQDIQCGEEICVSYGKNWFDERRLKVKEPSLRYKWRRLLPSLFLLCRFTLVIGVLFSVMAVGRALLFLSVKFS